MNKGDLINAVAEVVSSKKEAQEGYELIGVGQEKTRLKALAARGLTKFVGRKSSMIALKDPYERVLSGSGQVVGITGEAGVGKSRLLLELINQLPKSWATREPKPKFGFNTIPILKRNIFRRSEDKGT